MTGRKSFVSHGINFVLAPVLLLRLVLVRHPPRLYLLHLDARTDGEEDKRLSLPLAVDLVVLRANPFSSASVARERRNGTTDSRIWFLENWSCITH